MWVQMNETQERLYTYIAENPGCTRAELSYCARYFRKTGNWTDHLYTMLSGNPYGNITEVPQMIVQTRLPGEDQYRHWVIQGPFIPQWRREHAHAKRLADLLTHLEALVAA